jgi:hypothetical protein
MPTGGTLTFLALDLPTFISRFMTLVTREAGSLKTAQDQFRTHLSAGEGNKDFPDFILRLTTMVNETGQQ